MPVSQKPLRVTEFTDTLALNLQNRYYFYQLAAVDEMFNLSNFTEKIRVTLPDTIAPSAPFMKAPSLEGKVTILEWVTGGEADLAEVKIFRKENEKTDWQELAVVTVVDITSWADGAVPSGQKYTYRLQSVDASGNASEYSNRRSISIREREEVPGVSGLRYSAESEGAIRLDWQPPVEKTAFTFLIFKIENDGAPELLDTLPEATFTDRKVHPGNAYTYFVVTQDEEGRRSKMSDAVEVKF